MKVRHQDHEGYSITHTYNFGFVQHEQIDYYDHDGNWLRTDTVVGCDEQRRRDQLEEQDNADIPSIS